jgi:excisionase family DNA binding protein
MAESLEQILANPTTTVSEAGRLLGLARNQAYEAAARGEIKTLRFGRRLVVPTAWLKRVLELDAA